MNMDSIIWYCTEDGTLYPNEKLARKYYKKWCKDTGTDYYEEIFTECYKPISFIEYNQWIAGVDTGH